MANKYDVKKLYNVRDKINAVQYYIDLYLNKTLRMFKYENLPESLPEVELEKILQIHGYGIITEHNGELIALWGGLSGEMDVYYRPKYVIVANPWAGIDKRYEIDKDCILIKNTPLYKSIIPLIKKYGVFLTESELSLYIALINLRSIYNISASDNDDVESAISFLKELEKGNPGVLISDDFGKGISTNPFTQGTQGYLEGIIDTNEYLKKSLDNELGLFTSSINGRERVTSDEVNLSKESMNVLVKSMLEERVEAIEKINKKYGTNITVELAGSWTNEKDELASGVDEKEIDENEYDIKEDKEEE